VLKDIQVKNLSEYTDVVERICDEWRDEEGPSSPWFRGQADARWPLTPRAYRYTRISEDDLRSEFKRRSSPFLTEGRPNDDWDWYFLMQHYGIPTRLLDWTEGSLFALYFAVRRIGGVANVSSDAAAVWIVDPWWLNSRAIGQPNLLDTYDSEVEGYLPRIGSDTALPELPIAIRPPHIMRRIAAQLSRFTIYGGKKFWAEGLTPDEIADARIRKVTVPTTACERIDEALQRSGVTETTVFPDLEALCRELTLYYAHDPVRD
jgi:FRG domain